MPSVIVHFDIDAFFAQVEELRDPSLRGHPLGVQQHMEVASVNYEARRFGLYNRISVADAKRLCPQIVFVRGDNEVNGMQRYRKASHGVLATIASHLTGGSHPALLLVGRQVENPSFDDFYVVYEGQASIDESTHFQASTWASAVRAAILQQTGLQTSAGIASTKLMAMLATKRNKPNGQYIVQPSDEQVFMRNQRLQNLKGAGLIGIPPSKRETLHNRFGGDVTLGDWLAAIGDGRCEDDGDMDLAMQLARGADGSEVSKFALPKTISVELSVRVNDYEPCTSQSGIRAGYASLTRLLHGRALEDQALFGNRMPVSLVAKWKLFPSASQVRQKQTPWTFGSLATCDLKEIADVAMRLFNECQNGCFKISRLVLGITYLDNTVGNANGKRKQVSLSECFKRRSTITSAALPRNCIVLDD